MRKKYLFYDIEIFRYYNLIIFIDEQNKVTSFERFDDNAIKSKLTDKTLDEFINGYTLVGYNNYSYDDKILKMLLQNRSLKLVKQMSDNLVKGGSCSIATNDLDSLDCFKQILTMPSLKVLQANLGKNIVESPVPFDLDRPLTPEEIRQTKLYCYNDVLTTMQIYKHREIDYFQTKENLLNLLDDNTKKIAKKWNTTTISANLFKKASPFKTTLFLDKYKELYSKVPQEAFSAWQNGDNIKITHINHNVKYIFSNGGLHGVNNDKRKYFENVTALDVASLYPNLIIQLNVLGNDTTYYADLLQERLSIKATDKERSDALKLVINSVYGLLNNQYSSIYNPLAALSVCALGQTLLYYLCDLLYRDGADLINVNTDGVFFIGNYENAKREFEQMTGLVLELDKYDKFVQKDVNNYIALSTTGKVKTKGGDVSRFNYVDIFKNCNNTIVDECLVNYLIYDKPILKTLTDNKKNIYKFSMVLKAGRTFKGVKTSDGEFVQNVNRVIACKEGVQLYKVRSDDALVLFPDAPENMLIVNGELEKFEDFDQLDLQFYYDLVMKKLKKWT